MASETQGGAEKANITGNRLVQARSPGARIGIRFCRQTRDNHLGDNVFRGFARQIGDRRAR